MFDAELYREKSEVEEWKKRDPIERLINILNEKKFIDNLQLKELEIKIQTLINNAVEFAEKGTLEPLELLEKFVYSEMNG
jgi:TPP-dependent pyruvate/acetoin dehydrogenase alpha subunit